jgi:hypothetical protein
VSELPRRVPGADPSARARVNDAAASAERWLLTIERAVRAIGVPSQAIHRATRGGPLRARRPTGHRGRLLVERADVEAEIGAGGAGPSDTRRLTGAPRPAPQLGITGC